jgi:hypothetical protein
MLVEHTIITMNPNVKLSDFSIFGTGDNWEIIRWDSSEPKPDKQAVIDYWNANQDAVTESAKPKPITNVLGDLQKNQSDLIYQLMMAGVI